MSLELKNPTQQFPPGGGFGFVDPKTGMRFNGMEGEPRQTAQRIADHRRANPAIYPDGPFDIGAIIQEIFAQKNATMPWLFVGGPDDPGLPPVINKSGGVGGKCICGATEVTPILCVSCGGGRITGYKCSACGATRA